MRERFKKWYWKRIGLDSEDWIYLIGAVLVGFLILGALYLIVRGTGEAGALVFNLIATAINPEFQQIDWAMGCGVVWVLMLVLGALSGSKTVNNYVNGKKVDGD